MGIYLSCVHFSTADPQSFTNLGEHNPTEMFVCVFFIKVSDNPAGIFSASVGPYVNISN